MKKTKLLLVTSLMVLLTMGTVLVSAKKTETRYKASGTIDDYANTWSSEIISGRWSVAIKGDVLTYKGMYWELNLYEQPEDSPVGSVDIFTHRLTTSVFEFDVDGVLTFTGTAHVRKIWRKLAETTEILSFDPEFTITVTPESFLLVQPPPVLGDPFYGQDWDRTGTTTKLTQ